MPEAIASITIGQISAYAVFLAGVVLFIWKVVPGLRKAIRLVDDLTGTPARPGFDPRPGLMERVATIEKEVSYNGGQSLKDAVRDSRAEVAELKDTFHQHLEQPPIVQQDITVHTPPPT